MQPMSEAGMRAAAEKMRAAGAHEEAIRAFESAYRRLESGEETLLPSADLELLPRYCWETNTNYKAVRLMLDLGFPIAHTESSHGYSPLHNAAWSGDAALVDTRVAALWSGLYR